MAEPKNRRFIVLDVAKLEIREERTDERFLEYAYKTIGCTTVDVNRLTSWCDMWLDDEGLLKEPKRFVAWWDGEGLRQLAGTVILAGHDGEGETLGTTLALDIAKKTFFFVVMP
jgi:hypothetical protein